jgi:hypothetical protein
MADPPGATAQHAAGTVKLPLLGAVSKKTLAIGAVVAGGVLAYVYFRKARNGAAAATAGSTGTAPTVTDPAGNVCSALGPSGYCPGTVQDLAWSEQSGVGADPLGLDSGLGLGGGGQFFDPNAGQLAPAAPAPVTTNAEWEQEAIADLQDGGVSQATVSAAESGLPRYLAHLTLSDVQASAVQMAVGLAGAPPSGGPFSIRRAPPAHKPPPAAKVKVPDTVGLQYAAGAQLIHAAGLVPHQTGPGRIVQQRPAAETEVAKGSTVVLFGANK